MASASFGKELFKIWEIDDECLRVAGLKRGNKRRVPAIT
jgi:hypothetical protein